MDFVIGGVGVAALIFGITEALKEFGVSGKASRAVVLILGFLFVGVSAAMSQGLIPAEFIPLIELVTTAVAGGLSAMGYYDFLKKRTAR